MGFLKWTILSLEFCLCLLTYIFLVTDEPGRRQGSIYHTPAAFATG